MLDLGEFNATTAPKQVNLAYLVEQAIASKQQKPDVKPVQQLKWKATIHRLCNNNSSKQTMIGRLQFSTSSSKYNFKTLLIPVIDRSGSMSGNPTTQVKYSLNRIVDLIYTNTQLITSCVIYDDTHMIVDLNTTMSQQVNRNLIAGIKEGGGTQFSSAFEGIVKVVEKYKNDAEISSIVIVFLTDGEDNIPKEKRVKTVDNLKQKVEKVWTKKYVVHCVGFGSQHDSDFLNALRKIGSQEGAYRYADPNESSEILSGKINSLLDVIAQTSAIPIKLVPTETTPKIISGDIDKYWIILTGVNLQKPLEFKIKINNEETISVLAQYAEDENDPQIWDLWYTNLVDEIATELLFLSNQKRDTLDKQIHCELLEQRANSILTRIDGSSPNALRLQQLMENLKAIRSGAQINVLKLNDLKYEGQFQTKLNNPPPSQITPAVQSSYQPTPVIQQGQKTWEIIQMKNQKRCNAKEASQEFLKVLGKQSSKAACEWIEDNKETIASYQDQDGKNMLFVASTIGRCKIVRALLQTGKFQVDEVKNGFTALDYAIVYGYWYTAEILVEFGAKPIKDKSLLLRTCLSKRFFNTSSFLLKNKFAFVQEEMIGNAPTNEIITWLSGRSQKEIPIETAILKGMYDIVEEKLSQIQNISWQSYLSIFSNPTPDHHRIVEILIKNNKADPDEEVVVDDEGEKGISWPLFAACEKGQFSMFKLLVKYMKQSIDRQNHKGTTILWIACCNRHIDIVGELLNLGANPNIANFKGDSPLIPSCQKGNDTIVDMLIEAGARLDIYNKNRDGPVLICCRTGQAKILERLLKTLNPADLKIILNTYAEIDGFVPLLAATELDKVECIKVCYKFGAQLETRAGNDNQMIPGGTSLHLACFYGRLAAAKTLLDLGADLKSQSTVHGYTPLHYAIKNGHISVVRYLLTLPKIKECMQITDNEGRVPAYYASQVGNETMLDEFFTNKLAIQLGKLLYTDPEMEQQCAEKLLKYGQSLLVYEYDEITQIDINDGATILTYALLNGNQHLIQSLIQMGADFNKGDNHGISPLFWAAYLGQNISGIEPDIKILNMIEKVKTAAKSNMQSKMLTNLQQGGPQSSEYHPTPMNALVKMQDGYGTKINANVLASIKSQVTMDHSLLGFVDKLKSKKEFPEGEDILKYLIWDAKVNLIKRIAAAETDLQPVHLLSLYLYTSNEYIFKQVNQTLLKWQANSIWQNFINCLYQGISQIKPFQGEVYRAVDAKFNMQDYAIGNKVGWNTFSIASRSWKTCSDLINQKKGIIFIIKSNTGRDIGPYALDQVNEPICFLPGVEFVISNHFVANITCLGQANIRISTFKIKEKDYERACAGESSIIVELQEVDGEQKQSTEA